MTVHVKLCENQDFCLESCDKYVIPEAIIKIQLLLSFFLGGYKIEGS